MNVRNRLVALASRRLAIALFAGVAFAAFNAYVAASATPIGDARSDFDQLWFAARTVWGGGDPYAAIGPHSGAAFRFPWSMYYPLTTVVAALPLALLPLPLARALFVGVPAAWLAWLLAGREAWRPFGLLGAGVFFTARQAQWSMLAAASALTPALGGLLVLKPQLAIPWALAACSVRLVRNMIVTGAVLLAVSLAFDPGWIPRWLEAVRTAQHVRPLIIRPVAWVVLLALLRWRRFEARLLCAFLVTPINPLPYELTPLVLVPSSRTEMLVLALATWLTVFVQELVVGLVPPGRLHGTLQDVLVVGAFWPALVMVLRRPNAASHDDRSGVAHG